MSYGRDSSYGRGRGRSYGGGGGRGFNRGSPAPKPVEVGKEYEVDVNDAYERNKENPKLDLTKVNDFLLKVRQSNW